MPGVNKKPTSKSFNAVTPHRRSARRLCTSAPRPTGSCYGTKPTRGTLDLHHSKYNDTKLTRKSVTYVVELKCYPCEWRAQLSPPPTHSCFVQPPWTLSLAGHTLSCLANQPYSRRQPCSSVQVFRIIAAPPDVHCSAHIASVVQRRPP